jgi:sugar lactone lactonase YvrE
VLIADKGDNRIRRWWSDTGELATVAGTGTSGSTGDGAAAVAALLSGPKGVAVDGSGNIFIADTGNSKIRKVTVSTGVITTVAGSATACTVAPCGDGGAATSAKLNAPSDLLFRANGDLYIADTGTHTIRLLAGANISNVAGSLLNTGTADGSDVSARFNSPSGLGLDSGDVLYIADTGNNTIRKIPANSQTVSTVAGAAGQNTSCSGTAVSGITLSAPEDVVTVGTDYYIADSGHHRICRVSSGTSAAYMGTGSSGTGGDGGLPASAALETPGGLAYSSSLGLFVAHDVSSGRVRRVATPIVLA